MKTVGPEEQTVNDWWFSKEFSDWDRCIMAAEAAKEAGCDAKAIVYAVSKPWKWKQEAYAAHTDSLELKLALARSTVERLESRLADDKGNLR